MVLLRSKLLTPSSFGFVEFADIASAQEAHDSMKDVEIDGRRPNVDYSLPRKQNDGPQREQRAKNFGDETSPPSATLFVGNIPFQATEDMVGQIFGDHGSVISVRLPTKPENGEPKGFGYVEFASVEDATTAFEAMKGQSIEGRSIRLDYSQPRAGGGGGGRGRGGFGDRGGRGRGGFGDRGGRGRGGFGDRGGRGGGRGGRGGSSTNRGGFGEFKGKKLTF